MTHIIMGNMTIQNCYNDLSETQYVESTISILISSLFHLISLRVILIIDRPCLGISLVWSELIYIVPTWVTLDRF